MKQSWSRGSITLEMAIVVPILFFFIAGSGAVAYAAYAKAALQMTVMRAARELAAQEAAGNMDAGQLYQYKEFTETYGIPRAGVRMVVGQEDGIIRAAACYRVRLPLPTPSGITRPLPKSVEELQQFLEETGISGGDGQDPAIDMYLKQLTKTYTETSDAVRETAENAKNVTDQAASLWTRLQNLSGGSVFKRDQFMAVKGKKLSDSSSHLSSLCAGRGITVSAQSAFWSETSLKRPEPPPPLEVLIAPHNVYLNGVAPPGAPNEIQVKAKEPTRCDIRVRYSTGLSAAKGVETGSVPTTSSAQGDTVTWKWNVGTQTASGTWPVSVSCDNGQSVVVHFDVINPKSPASNSSR